MTTTTSSTIAPRTLVITTLSTLILALLVTVTLVLPAEFGRDPTGIGAYLGLLELTEAGNEPATSASPATTSSGERQFVLNLAPGMGTEFKLVMPAQAELAFAWTTNGAPVYFDQHGEPEGDTSGYFLSYSEGNSTAIRGHLLTRFAGTHGWYWENRSADLMTITLTINGDYPLMEKQH